ncbi:acyl-CoA dehydrogenase, partial [bacterium]|nr:acyl-CoA dehydrogenase [bacterium]
MTHPTDKILLDPRKLDRSYADDRSSELIAKTVAWFEARGKDRLLEAYNEEEWYADFLEFVKKERIFASVCTPTAEGAGDTA